MIASNGEAGGDRTRLTLQKGVLDLETGELIGTAVTLTRTELELVAWLASADAPVSTGTLLQEVWGYRPGVKSRTVYSTIERVRRKLEVDPRDPRHLVKEALGYAFQVAEAAPELPPDFVGRAREVESVLGMLRRGGAVGLHGPPGVGKTRLAREVFRCVEKRFSERFWVDLRGVRPLPDALIRIGRALGLNTGEPDRIRVAFGERASVLLVLDDLDDLGPDGAAELLGIVGDTSTILTSRRRAPAISEALVLEGLAPWACRALLRDRGVSELSDDTLDEAAARFDHLPLALHLTAPWLQAFGRDTLNVDVRSLAGLSDAIAGSWERASEAQRAWLSALAVVGGTAPIDLAVELGPPRASAHLDALTSLSLVELRSGRVTLLETVREFALERAADPESVRLDALAWAGRSLSSAVSSLGTPDHRVAIERIESNLDVIERVLDTAPRTRLWCRAVDDLLPILWRVGLFPAVDAWVRERVEHAVDGEDEIRARITQSLVAERRGGDPLAPLEVGPRPEPSSELGASFHVQLGNVLQRRGRIDEAESVFRELLGAWRSNTFAGRRAHLGLAQVHRAAARPEEALEVLGELDRLATMAGDATHLVATWGVRGQVLRRLGSPVQAELWLRKARAEALEQRDFENAAHIAQTLAGVCGMSGELAEGRRLLRDALRFYRSHGLIRSFGFAHLSMASLCLWSDEIEECLENLTLAEQAFASTRNELGVRNCRVLRGRALAAGEAWSRARDALRLSIDGAPLSAERARAVARGLWAVCAVYAGTVRSADLDGVRAALHDDDASRLVGELLDRARAGADPAEIARVLGSSALEHAGG